MRDIRPIAGENLLLTVSQPVVIRSTRPYASEAAFLAAEAWTLDKKGMVLLEQDELPAETIVRFELKLESGERLMRAEGQVHGYLEPEDGRPGGLKLRFRRFDAGTKALLLRAAALNTEEAANSNPRPPLASLVDASGPEASVEPILSSRNPAVAEPAEPEARAASEPLPDPSAEIDALVAEAIEGTQTATDLSEAEPSEESSADRSDNDDEITEVQIEELHDVEAGALEAEAQRAEQADPEASVEVLADAEPPADVDEPSGVHRRPVGPIATPANREELLAKLRKRAKQVSKTSGESVQDSEAG